MLILTSPAKTLNIDSGKNFPTVTEPQFKKEALQLVRILKKKKLGELKELMGISDKLAIENLLRYKNFEKSFDLDNANPAIFAFRGDVYQGFDVDSMSEEAILSSHKRIRILSGLYGILKPLDLMQAYRLEMGTSLANKKGKNLYDFWGTKITNFLNHEIKDSSYKYILNLASNEYFKVIQPKKLKATLITANFKEYRNDELKFISFNAKKARGMMMKYVINNNIFEKEDLKGFNYEGYAYDQAISSEDELIFTK